MAGFLKRVRSYLEPIDLKQTAPSSYLDPKSVEILFRGNHRGKLGEGAFTKVFEGRFEGQPCAVKVFKENVLKNKEHLEEHDLPYICDLKGPNIVQIHGLWLDPYKGRNALSLVMELCDTSLYEYIKSHKVRVMPKRDKLKILHDVTNAMIYLHNEHIVHGDLRSPNVLLVNTRPRVDSSDEQPQITAKVADFDLARHIDLETITCYTTTFAEEDYLPPEAIDEEKFKYRKHECLTFSVDVFCFGPLAIELACMEFPKPTVKVERKKGRVVKFRDEIERREKYLKKINFSERMYTDLIVAQCMAERPENRGSFLDLQLIIEAFQRKMEDHPNHELLEEQQAQIFDMRRKMEEDAKTLAELETLPEELDYMSKINEDLQENLRQTEKDLARVTAERDVSMKSMNGCLVELGHKEKEIKRIRENWQLIVIEKDGYYREAIEAKNQLTEIKKKVDELERALHSAKAQLKKEEEKLRASEEEKTSLSTRLMKAEESLEDTKPQLKKEEEKLRAAEEEKTSLSTRLKEAEESLEDTIAQLKEEEKKLRAAEEEKTSLSTRLTKAEESLEHAKEQRTIPDTTEERLVKEVVKRSRAYLQDQLRIDKDFISGLQAAELLGDNDARRIRSSVAQEGDEALYSLLEYMEWFYDEEMLGRFCTFLEEKSKPAKPMFDIKQVQSINLSIGDEIVSLDLQPLEKQRKAVEEEKRKIEEERDELKKQIEDLQESSKGKLIVEDDQHQGEQVETTQPSSSGVQ